MLYYHIERSLYKKRGFVFIEGKAVGLITRKKHPDTEEADQLLLKADTFSGKALMIPAASYGKCARSWIQLLPDSHFAREVLFIPHRLARSLPRTPTREYVMIRPLVPSHLYSWSHDSIDVPPVRHPRMFLSGIQKMRIKTGFPLNVIAGMTF